MKKCSRCRIVYYTDDRGRCLYCDTVLLSTDKDDSVGFLDDKGFDPNVGGGGLKREQPVLKEILKEKELQNYLRVQFLIGTYFKIRTFRFLYTFSREQFKMGQGFKRTLAQPLNISSFLTIPWVVVDIVDSFFIRLLYTGYCPQCGWKFKQITAGDNHDPVECEYNKEYSTLVSAIMTGEIVKTEGRIKQEALKKVKEGKRSAYKDLCSRRTTSEWLLDVLCVWTSIAIIAIFVISFSMPLLMAFVQKLEVG